MKDFVPLLVPVVTLFLLPILGRIFGNFTDAKVESARKNLAAFVSALKELESQENALQFPEKDLLYRELAEGGREAAEKLRVFSALEFYDFEFDDEGEYFFGKTEMLLLLAVRLSTILMAGACIFVAFSAFREFDGVQSLIVLIGATLSAFILILVSLLVISLMSGYGLTQSLSNPKMLEALRSHLNAAKKNDGESRDHLEHSANKQ